MKYKIHVTTEDGELLDTFETNSAETNWDSHQMEVLMGIDIMEEIRKDVKRRSQ